MVSIISHMNIIKASLILHTILSPIYSTKHTSFHHKITSPLPSPQIKAASKDLDLTQGDTPLIITGVIPKSFSLDTIPSILETYFTSQSTNESKETPIVRVDITPLTNIEAPLKLSNGTTISPYQLAIPIDKVIPLFTTSSPIERGYNAYIRLLNLQSHPKLTSLLPLARVLHLAGSNLISANLWLGDGSIKSAIHYDGQDNLLLQLSGTKTILLIPPELEPYMQYKKYTESRFVFDETTGKFVDGALKSTSKTVMNHGTFDPFSSKSRDHEQQFDFIKGSRAMISTLHPGETLFLPALWSHAVVSSTGLNVAVNLWFVQKSVSHRKAIERHSSWSAGHFLLGNDLLAQSHYTEAEIAYRKSLEIEPDNFDASHNLASALEGKGDRTAAINQYREAFTLHRSIEEGVQCLTNIGVILKKIGDLEEAEVVCKEAVELDSESGKAWKLYGNVLALNEKFEAADEALGTAVKLLRSANDKVAALSFITAFDKLAKQFSEMEGWEVRQERGSAYLHVSKPNWLDQNMNGIHLETYVMDDQLQMGYAPVCVHCEGGFPKQHEFMLFFTEQARAIIESWPGYTVGPKGCSVCEIMVPIKSTADETIIDLAAELIRLQSLTSMIDQTIEDVLAM